MFSPPERVANLLGAFALEATTAQTQAGGGVLGQGGATVGALVTIAAHPQRTVEELRAPLGLTQPGATRLVQRLVDAGWVERSGPGGRGGHRLAVTAAGPAVLGQIFEARRAALLALLGPLSEPEQQDLAAMLERLLASRTAG